MFRKYKRILKEEGWKGLIQKEGWKIALLLFLFFFLKGLLWLALGYWAFNQAT